MGDSPHGASTTRRPGRARRGRAVALGTALELPPGELHVWSFSLAGSAARVASLARFLSEDERERAARLVREDDRRRFIVGRAKLRRLLARYTRSSAGDLRFAYGPHGKPSLKGAPELGFNLSHSENLAICAVAHGAHVGIDVEKIRVVPDLAQVAHFCLSRCEATSLMRVGEGRRTEAFFACLTRREAFLKARGEGIFASLTTLDVNVEPWQPARLISLDGGTVAAGAWLLQDLDAGTGFVACVAAEGGPWRLRRLSGTARARRLQRRGLVDHTRGG